jgi:hypothetical protein
MRLGVTGYGIGFFILLHASLLVRIPKRPAEKLEVLIPTPNFIFLV